jgi:dihydrofolate synthase / folylpolyglutamate synthase
MYLPLWPKFVGSVDIDLKLERVTKFLQILGNPQNNLKNIVHIAGTNGKGSTLAMLRNLLEKNNFTVNCYNSPHLIDFNERIRICGKLISDQNLNQASLKLKKIAEENPEIKLSFFEATTIMAIMLFAENQADYNLIETGLGGRLDATNIFNEKLAAIITNIGFDHQEFLGDKLTDIAKEKLAICKNAKLKISAWQKDEIKKLIKESKLQNYADDYFIKDNYFHDPKLKEPINIKNNKFEFLYQEQNFATAAKAFLEVTNYKFLDLDLKDYIWPARNQSLPNLSKKYGLSDTWLDGGHNQDAFLCAKEFILKNKIEYVILGAKKTKDIKKMLKIFDDLEVKILFTEIDDFDDCYKIEDMQKYNFHGYFSDFSKALEKINKSNSKALILGSLILSGLVLRAEKYKIN